MEQALQSFFESTVDTGFRPGSRAPFVSGKGPKTIDAPPGLIGSDGRRGEGASQLAVLIQGSPRYEGVRLKAQTAGVG